MQIIIFKEEFFYAKRLQMIMIHASGMVHYYFFLFSYDNDKWYLKGLEQTSDFACF